VNKRQKILTLIFLLLFVGTLLFCPWYCAGITQYWPFFVNNTQLLGCYALYDLPAACARVGSFGRDLHWTAAACSNRRLSIDELIAGL